MENKLKIAFLDFDTLGYDLDTKQFDQFSEVIVYGHTQYHETVKRLQNVDIAITNKVVIDKNIIDNTNLKLICVAATGMNNIDLDYANLKKITIKNVKGYSTNSVSQLTFTFALNFIQEFEYYTKYTQNKEWEKSHIFVNLDKPFVEICNKKWGIIGLGEIGKSVAKIAQAFGCEVQYYSTSGHNNCQEFKKVDLETILRTSDIISIHCPLNENTKNLISEKELRALRDKAIVINVGRGGIIKEKDLAKVIDQKEIYVGLDVLEYEPINPANPLNFISNKNRIKITPHIGWSSVEARNRLTEGILNNIKQFVLECKL